MSRNGHAPAAVMSTDHLEIIMTAMSTLHCGMMITSKYRQSGGATRIYKIVAHDTPGETRRGPGPIRFFHGSEPRSKQVMCKNAKRGCPGKGHGSAARRTGPGRLELAARLSHVPALAFALWLVFA